MREQRPNTTKPKTRTVEAVPRPLRELVTRLGRTARTRDDASEKGLMTHLSTIGYGAE